MSRFTRAKCARCGKVTGRFTLGEDKPPPLQDAGSFCLDCLSRYDDWLAWCIAHRPALFTLAPDAVLPEGTCIYCCAEEYPTTEDGTRVEEGEEDEEDEEDEGLIISQYDCDHEAFCPISILGWQEATP